MRSKVLLTLAIAGLPLVLGGCFLNVFQTARTLNQGEVLFGLGIGFSSLPVDADTTITALVPQAQIGIGVGDGVQLTFQGGAVTLLGGEEGASPFMFSGAMGEVKLRLLDAPDGLAMALGLGGGYGFTYLGWGLHATFYLDSNIRVLPLYLVYRPLLSFGGLEGSPGSEMHIGHQFAGGLKLPLSDTSMLLLELDYQLFSTGPNPDDVWHLFSPGISLLVSF